MSFPLDRPMITSHSFGWQDNQFGVDIEWHGNSDRRNLEKPFSLQKLKVWLNSVRGLCDYLACTPVCARTKVHLEL